MGMGADPAPPEPVVVVQKVRDTPPAELTRCPVQPEGVPAGTGLLSPEVRAGIARGFRALGANTDQLNRLITWTTGEPCPGVTAD